MTDEQTEASWVCALVLFILSLSVILSLSAVHRLNAADDFA